MVIKFDLEESEEMEMSVDSLVVDSISQDTLLNIEQQGTTYEFLLATAKHKNITAIKADSRPI